MVRVQISGGAKAHPVVLHDAYGSFGAVHLYGTKGDLAVKLTDTYHAFGGQPLSCLSSVCV